MVSLDSDALEPHIETFRSWWSEHESPVRDFVATVQEVARRLELCGADRDSVIKVVLGVTQAPAFRRFSAMLRTVGIDFNEWARRHDELSSVVRQWEALVDLCGQPFFQELPLEFKYITMVMLDRYTRRFSQLIVPIYEAWHQAPLDNPLLPLLETMQPVKHSSGAPSRGLATFFMTLIADHLQERGRRPQLCSAEILLEAPNARICASK